MIILFIMLETELGEGEKVGAGVPNLLEISSLHRNILHLSEIYETEEMGRFSLQRKA